MGVEDRRVMVTKAKLGRIGDAIRYKLGESVNYTLDQMPDAIMRISGGPGPGPTPPSPSNIIEAAEMYYNDEISLEDVKSMFSLGNSFIINLAAIEKGDDWGEDHIAQPIEMQIVSFNTKLLETRINGHDKALFTLQMKDCLVESGEFSVNSFGNTVEWIPYQERRNWANTKFMEALPQNIQDAIKPVLSNSPWFYNSYSDDPSVENAYYYGNKEGTDIIYLPTHFEIIGGTADWDVRNAQYDYYKTVENRIKRQNGVVTAYATASVSYRGSGSDWASNLLINRIGNCIMGSGPNGAAYPLSFAFNI
jgi:hypothetical protein